MPEHRQRRAGAAPILLGLVVVLGLLTAPLAAAQPAGPRVELDPVSGPPGTKVTVTATCRTQDDQWRIEGLTKRALDAKHRGTATLTVPTDAKPGPSTVVITCYQVGDGIDPVDPPVSAQTAFVVEERAADPVKPARPPALTAKPTSGAAGTTVVLTGNRLPSCPAGWTVRIAGAAQTPTVRSLGPEAAVPDRFRAVLAVTVPAGAKAGNTRAELACGGPVASAAFRVVAAKVEPSTVEVPDLVGLTLDRAADALTTRRLTLAEGAAAERGPITGQSPAAGTKVARGTAVRVEQAPPSIVLDAAGSVTLPGVGLGGLALGAAALVLRSARTRAGREWARQHVRVVAGAGR